MELTINGRHCKFVPLVDFRNQWHLPETFGIVYFEKKDWPVGDLREARQPLSFVKQRVLEAVPLQVLPPELLLQIEQLTTIFRYELEQVNEDIGLREVEIDFAVDGFHNVLHDVAYRLLELNQVYRGDTGQIRAEFDFTGCYQAWLDAVTRVLTTSYSYTHNGVMFDVRIVYSAYGRVGLEVTVNDQVHYVLDSTLACPAINFMEVLCRQTAQALCEALTSAWLQFPQT